MENKVVLHVMGMDSSKYGGIERFNVMLARELWREGYVGVFVYESEPASINFVTDMEHAHGEIVVLNSKKHFKFCFEFAKLINKYRPVLVHSHFTKARFFAVPIAYMNGIRRLFITIHGEMGPKSHIKFHTRLWYYLINKVVRVITVSDELASEYRANWPKSKVKRVYLGVKACEGEKKTCRDILGIPQGQTMLLSVSNFNKIKGLDVLCKAMQLLKERGILNDSICLYIVGQPKKELDDLNSFVEELGVKDYVRLVGISDDVYIFLKSSDLYIQASRSEGIGLALMEAASASLPLIGTKVGGIPEVVREGCNGFLVEPDNAMMLADAMELLIQNEILREDFGNNSFSVYQDCFSVESGVTNTIAYYELDSRES